MKILTIICVIVILLLADFATGALSTRAQITTVQKCDGTLSGLGRCEQSSTNASCTISAVASFCSTSITFPTRFTNVPNLSDLSLTLDNPATPTFTIQGSHDNLFGTWIVLANILQNYTLTNFPVNITPFFNATERYIPNVMIVNWSNMTGIDMYDSCVEGSTSDNARILLQYSVDQANTWINMTNTEVDVGQSGLLGDCDVGSGATPTGITSWGDSCMVNMGSVSSFGCYSPIPAQAQTVVLVRVAEFGGNGAGDTVKLTTLKFDTIAFSSTTTSSINSLILLKVSALSATSFTVQAFRQVSTGGTLTVSFGWKCYSVTG